MSLTLILIIVLVLILIGGLPNWNYHQAGYAPSGIVGVILVILVLWLILGGRGLHL